MPRNEGRIPPACEIRDESGNISGWRKVHVKLFGGHDTRKAGLDPWPAAGGRPVTSWTLNGGSHDILEFEVA